MVRKILLGSLAVIFVALGTAYFAGMAYFQTHYLAGTSINGFQCSFMMADDAEALLKRSVESYALEIDTRNNGVEKITAEEAGLLFCGRAELEKVLEKQNYFLWFLPSGGTVSLTANAYEIDSEKLDGAISGLSCMENMVQAQPAKIVETSGFYQVSSSIRGTELDVEKSKDVISTAMRQWKASVSLEETGCYIDIDGPDEAVLQENCDLLNRIQDFIITYDFGDRTETVDFEIVKGFLDETGALEVGLVEAYLEQLAQKYDTVGIVRKFVTYDDQAVQVSGGDYGWQMDTAGSAEALIEMVKNNEIRVVSPVYQSTAVSRDKNDIGHSYLEIDTKNKRAILYVDGVPTVQADIHLGSEVKTGTYAIHGLDTGRISLQNGSIYPYEETSFSGFSGTNDIIGISASGVDVGSIALDCEDLKIITGVMDSTWPVIIY